MTAAAGQEALEAESALELDRPVGIALAGSDGIAKAGDKDVAHRNLGGNPLGGAVAKRNVDGRDRAPAGTDAQFDLLIARRCHLTRRPVAVVKAPEAILARRHRAGDCRPDRVIARRKIVLALAVAFARLEQVSRIVETKIADDVLGPAEAVGVMCETPFSSKHAIASARRHHAQKIGLVAEQAEPVLDLPGDVKIPGSRKLRGSRIERSQDEEQSQDY